MSFTELIEINPRKLGGVPVFRGTRIPVSRLFDYLETGSSVEDFIGEYEIDPELVRRFMRALYAGASRHRRLGARHQRRAAACMKVLLDHDVPHGLRHELFGEHEVYTAHYMGWENLENGDLLQAAEESDFSVLVTIDKKMGFQQNLATIRFVGIVFLRAHPAKLARLQRLMPTVTEALPSAARGWHLSVFR